MLTPLCFFFILSSLTLRLRATYSLLKAWILVSWWSMWQTHGNKDFKEWGSHLAQNSPEGPPTQPRSSDALDMVHMGK